MALTAGPQARERTALAGAGTDVAPGHGEVTPGGGEGRIRLSTAPILWNNDDLPDERGGYRIPYTEVLDAIAKARFEATELGSNYPRDPTVLREALQTRGLALSGAYWCPGLTDAAQAEAALDEVEDFLAFLEAIGCEFLVAAEPLNRPRRDAALPADGWKVLSQALDELGWRCKGRGIRLVFHNHAGTWVETPDEVAKLLGMTDPARVGFCLDTGHWTVGGGDAAAAVREHLPRLKYLHLKDVDPTVLAALRTEGFDFREALRRRIFTELGTGCVDVAAISATLRDAGWSGWVVSEQDTSWREPCDTAAHNSGALRGAFPHGSRQHAGAPGRTESDTPRPDAIVSAPGGNCSPGCRCEARKAPRAQRTLAVREHRGAEAQRSRCPR